MSFAVCIFAHWDLLGAWNLGLSILGPFLVRDLDEASAEIRIDAFPAFDQVPDRGFRQRLIAFLAE